MKKSLLMFILFVAGSLFLAAEDIDFKVKNAVDALTLRLNTPLEVSVGEICLFGTQSSSELSRFLHNKIITHALNNDKLIVLPPSRGIIRVRVENPQRGIIKGAFLPAGELVHVTLQLVIESLVNPNGEIYSSADFVISSSELQKNGITLFPSNMETLEEIKEQEDLFIPPDNNQTFKIEAWPNSDSFTYFAGDELEITIESNQDCYFKVYHIDVHNQVQLLYPNEKNQNNQLQAYIKQTIPEPDTFKYKIHSPYGQDTIIVIASSLQFPNIESEFTHVEQVTKDIIADIMNGRGRATETVTSRFNFTSLPGTYYDETYSYPKPQNLLEAINSVQAYLLLQGGTLVSNGQEGTFRTREAEGIYRITGDTVIINLRYTTNQLNPLRTRGTGFTFYIDRPRDILQAVQSVRAGIEAKGGTFNGNEQQGSFRASGIAGHYRVSDRVNVSISEKPVFIPGSLIEKEVRNYFNGK